MKKPCACILDYGEGISATPKILDCSELQLKIQINENDFNKETYHIYRI